MKPYLSRGVRFIFLQEDIFLPEDFLLNGIIYYEGVFMYDICIVGAGMSGLTAAIYAAKYGFSVVLLEKNKKVGMKLYATGNGKCNLANKNMNIEENYYSNDDAYKFFLDASYNGCTEKTLRSFYNEIGLKVYEDSFGYIYPCSNQASSVVWALKDRIDAYGVKTFTDTCVENIDVKSESIRVEYSSKKHGTKCLDARYLILACGGKSNSKLGGSEYGYRLCRGLGHNITRLAPALCALNTDSELHMAENVRVKSTAKLMIDDEIKYESKGEIQITSYGLSGIAIFNLASRAQRALYENHKVYIKLNLIENTGYKAEELAEYIIENSSDRTIMGALNAVVHEKLAGYALAMDEISPKTMVSDISYQDVLDTIKELQDYKCPVTDAVGYDNSQVTSGGVFLKELVPESFESKIKNNVYIVGELLDIDGICGGYNLTFAIISAICAVRNIYDKNKPD